MTIVGMPGSDDELAATLTRWYRRDGEFVLLDEPICEIETDSASADVPAPASGILRHLANEGDRVFVTSKLARIDPPPGRP